MNHCSELKLHQSIVFQKTLQSARSAIRTVHASRARERQREVTHALTHAPRSMRNAPTRPRVAERPRIAHARVHVRARRPPPFRRRRAHAWPVDYAPRRRVAAQACSGTCACSGTLDGPVARYRQANDVRDRRLQAISETGDNKRYQRQANTSEIAS
jgi:hypothetical protein